jgi:DNA polymerase III subunit alpha
MAPKRQPILPSLAGDLEGEAAQLRADAVTGLDLRLATYTLSPDERQVYDDRLQFECDIIVGMGFPGYFLIVADFIKWAKEQGIPVGPGRGSGAGSLVAWALTITDLDPIELGLLFERFLNPERVSMPDFDIDFCETRRGEVIRYVQQKYGGDHVAQIITFGKLKARAVLRDTGRVLQMSYGQVDRLCKLVPNHPTDPWDLDRTMKGVPEVRHEIDRDPQVARLFNLARQLEGFPRHSSTHAAGVVIGDRPLDQLVPLYRDPRSDMPVTQFDMKYVETAGLVKFDFLGLKTLSVLRKALDLLGRRGITVDLDTLPRDDEAVYALLKRGDTVGVFQLESEGMRRTLSAVKPTNFGDIIALVSLYRPGPMDNIPMFGRRKNGEESIIWPHDLLEPILSETYGVFVYQEQVMQAAQILAGYSLGDADLLRRAMGKKVQAEMDAQRGRFCDGCAERDIPAAKANELFDLIDKFAGYGFNKSHAAAYALLAYQTAYLKAHYPHEFFAASMCFDMHQTDKLSIFIDDMRRSKIACLPPCVNASEAEYSVEARPDGSLAVRYALAGLKNVGEKAMEQLVVERQENGQFDSLEDFAGRIDPTLINKRSFENLAAAGAFDGLYPNRAALVEGADVVLATAQSAREERASGQGGLFGEATGGAQPMRLPATSAWSAGAQMGSEKEAFGFYFAAHPVSQFRAVAMAKGAQSHADLMASGPVPVGERRPATMAVLIENVRWRDGKRSRFVMAECSDESGQFTATCFDDAACESLSTLAETNACALLRIELDMREGDETPRVSIRGAEPLAGMTVVHRLRLVVEIEHEHALLELAAGVAAMRGGHGELVALVRTLEGEAVAMRLGNDFDFTPESAQILDGMNGLSVVAIEPIRIAGGNSPRPRRHLKSVN